MKYPSFAYYLNHTKPHLQVLSEAGFTEPDVASAADRSVFHVRSAIKLLDHVTKMFDEWCKLWSLRNPGSTPTISPIYHKLSEVRANASAFMCVIIPTKAENIIRSADVNDINSMLKLATPELMGVLRVNDGSAVCMVMPSCSLHPHDERILTAICSSAANSYYRACEHFRICKRLSTAAEKQRQLDMTNSADSTYNKIMSQSADNLPISTSHEDIKQFIVSTPTQRDTLPNPMSMSDTSQYTCEYYRGPISQMPFPISEVFGSFVTETMAVIHAVYDAGLPTNVPLMIRVVKRNHRSTGAISYVWLISDPHDQMFITSDDVVYVKHPTSLKTHWIKVPIPRKSITFDGRQKTQAFVAALKRVGALHGTV